LILNEIAKATIGFGNNKQNNTPSVWCGNNKTTHHLYGVEITIITDIRYNTKNNLNIGME